jgi:ribosomal protein S18 acetylase RimI-like enzyme
VTEPTSPKTLTTRRATRDDIPFLAWCNFEATSPHPGFCYWDPLLEHTGTPTMQFIEAVLHHDALAWGAPEQFFILEENAQPIAGASAFTMDSNDYRPLHLERLQAVAQDLNWSNETLERFLVGYGQVWREPKDRALAPQAPWIIECVAVRPEQRGRGMTRRLFEALFDEGRRLGHAEVGISVTTGNQPAERAYEAIGFQLYLRYGSEYFGGAFPGTTKYRLKLTTNGAT